MLEWVLSALQLNISGDDWPILYAVFSGDRVNVTPEMTKKKTVAVSDTNVLELIPHEAQRWIKMLNDVQFMCKQL